MQLWKRLALASTLLVAAAGSLRATLSTEYIFAASNAPYASPSGATTLAIGGTTQAINGTFNDSASSALAGIGFPFTFDGVTYTTFSVSTSGRVMLGNDKSGSYANNLATATLPAIAPWWDHQHMYDGGGAGAGCTMSPVIGVRYALSGIAPNQVMTIEFATQVWDDLGSAWWAGCGAPMNTYQVRLHEGTNVIEMHYKTLWASSAQPTSGSIGLTAGAGNFISVTPNGGTATTSSVAANNTIATHLTPIAGGTLYTFTPCGVRAVGRTAGQFDGGTVQLLPNDTLLAGQSIRVGEQQAYTPMDLSVAGGGCLDRSYKLELSGPNAADYSFGTPSTSMLIAGAPAQTPSIIFAPTSFGPRYATLTLTDLTNNSQRSWALGGTGAVGLIGISSNGQPLDTASQLFTNTSTCVGDQLVILPLEVTLTGTLPVTITSIEVYKTDTTVTPSEPRYRLSRDGSGRAIPMDDYVITESSPVVATGGIAPMPTPRTITEETQLFLTFNPQRMGPRFGRVIIRTDAKNVFGRDTNGVPTEGIFDLDLYGRGEGALLSSTHAGHLLSAVEMGSVRLGQTSRRWVQVVNAGSCVLRIIRPNLEIASGDVGEFHIDSLSQGFAGTVDDYYYNLMPGAVDSILISFTPKQIGSRRASLYFRTNDSLIGGTPGTERGTFILDLNGNGAAGLYASVMADGADLGIGLIGDVVGPFSGGVVRLSNNGSAPAIINSLAITGGDNGDFGVPSAATWPTTPFVLQPGMVIDLPVEFRPLAGTPGPRSSALRITTDDGNSVDAWLKGVAGTRLVTATPLAMSFPTVRTGRLVRRIVTITNTGTFPVKLAQPELSGTNPDRFELGVLPRLELAPGQVEFLEVTFRPNVAGAATATATIGTNAPSGPITIALDGTANSTRYKDDDPDATSIGNNGLDAPDEDSTQIGLAAGVANGLGAFLRLDAVAPNPTSSEATVRFAHTAGTTASLALVDARGSVVWSETSATSAATERTVRVPVSNLPSGTYILRMTAGGRTLVRSIIVAR